MTKLEIAVAALQQHIQEQAWTIISEKDVQSGKQFRISDGISVIPVTYYTTGNILVQGDDSSLKTQLQEWVTAWKQTGSTTQKPKGLWES